MINIVYNLRRDKFKSLSFASSYQEKKPGRNIPRRYVVRVKSPMEDVAFGSRAGRGDLIDFIGRKKSLAASLIPYYHTGQRGAIMGSCSDAM